MQSLLRVYFSCVTNLLVLCYIAVPDQMPETKNEMDKK